MGPEFRVNTYTINNQGLASVAAGNGGDFVSGPGQDGSGFGVFGQRYDVSKGGIPRKRAFRALDFLETWDDLEKRSATEVP